MLKNKKFAKYAIAFNIIGIIFMFLYSGLQNDQVSIIQGFSAWTAEATQLPVSVGNFVCIVLTFIFGTCFIKFGVRKTLLPCIAISALGCVGIAAANGLASMSPALVTGQHAANDPAVQDHFHLNGGISPGIQNLPANDVLNKLLLFHHNHSLLIFVTSVYQSIWIFSVMNSQ